MTLRDEAQFVDGGIDSDENARQLLQGKQHQVLICCATSRICALSSHISLILPDSTLLRVRPR